MLLRKAMCWFELLYGGEGRRDDYRIISDSTIARMMAVQKGLGVVSVREQKREAHLPLQQSLIVGAFLGRTSPQIYE